jgi:hypothetical protein
MQADELAKHLVGQPVNAYPLILTTVVKAAHASNAFDDGSMGEFVRNFEAGLTAVPYPKQGHPVIFATKATPRLALIHDCVQKGTPWDKIGQLSGLHEHAQQFYNLAGHHLRVESLLYELAACVEADLDPSKFPVTKGVLDRIKALDVRKYEELVTP